MNFEDEVVIRSAQEGDIEAFEEIVEQYQSMIYNLSYRMLGNPDDALDASQEVFIKIYKSIDKFKFDSKFSTWVYRITNNYCLDIIRKNKNTAVSIEKDIETDDGHIHREMPDEGISVENSVVRSEKIELVRKAILKLPDEYRTVIVLRDLEGESYTDIASILSLPEGTVKSRINRGRRELKNILERDTELFSEYSVKI